MTMASSANSDTGGTWKPIHAPTGVNGSAVAIVSAASDVQTSGHRRAAPDERDAFGAQHVQCRDLGPHRHDEPSRLERGDEQQTRPIPVQLREPPACDGRAEQGEQHGEGDHIEQRAHRPEATHEPGDRRRVPPGGGAQDIAVDAVPWDRETGQVVYEVQQHHLHGCHGHERQERAGDHHRDDIAEIRAQRQLDVLHHVDAGAPALRDAAQQHVEVLVREHDIRRLSDGLGAGAGADGDFAGVHGRQVVDAVAHVSHAMPLAAQQ